MKKTTRFMPTWNPIHAGCYYDGTQKVYTSSSLTDDVWEKFEEIEDHWIKLQDAYYESGKDRGGVVICAGFYVWYVPKGMRKPRVKMIVLPYGYQNSLIWETSKDEIAAMIQNLGIDASYKWGKLD